MLKICLLLSAFSLAMTGIDCFLDDFLRDLDYDLNVRLKNEMDTMNDNINAAVYAGLEPVRALSIMADLRSGVGGFTIIKYDDGKSFLLKDSVKQECVNGTIDAATGNCTGELKDPQIDENDVCHMKQHAIVNNFICLSNSNGGVTTTVINNKMTCTTHDNSKVVIMTLKKMKKRCKHVTDKIHYTYVADEKNPLHVRLPNENQYVNCKVVRNGYCEFDEDAIWNQNYSNSVIIS